MIGATKQALSRAMMLTGVRTLSRFISRRAHTRPALWCVASNDDWHVEAWQG